MKLHDCLPALVKPDSLRAILRLFSTSTSGAFGGDAQTKVQRGVLTKRFSGSRAERLKREIE
jgi:hypothetical protein